MTRKNLKVTEDTYDILREEKRDMETWDSMLRRLVNNSGWEDDPYKCDDCGERFWVGLAAFNHAENKDHTVRYWGD